MKYKDLYIAVYLEEALDEGLPFPVYIPDRVMLGTIDEKTNLFTEYFTGQKFINTDLAYAYGVGEGFNMALKVSDLKKKHPFKSLGEIYLEHWLDLEKYVYFYDEVTLQLLAMSVTDFNKNFNANLQIFMTDEINNLYEALINGDVKAIEKYNEMLGNDTSVKPTDVVEYKMEKPISETIENIKKSIISQDEAVKKIVVAIYKNLIFNNETMKSNILMYGPTGVGKTAIIKAIAKEFDVPVWIEDMTRFTEVGYKGSNIDDILINLYENADSDLEKAQRSILFLDEIDKKAGADEEKSFNKSGVLKSMLKIIEGGVFNVELNQFESIKFDTSHLTIIAGGAFTDLYNNRKTEEKTRIIGFGESEETKENKTSDKKKDITIKEFEKYGMSLEFMGRFKTIVRLNELKTEDLVSILKNSELSALKNYKEILKKKGIELNLTDNIYEHIAKIAESYKTGARSLNIVVDNIFENILFELFDNKDNVESILLGENITEDKSDYKLVRKLDK